MTTLDELLAAGEPETPKPRKARLALASMAIATAIITTAGTAAFAASDLATLLARHHRHPATTAKLRTPAPAPSAAPGPGR